VLVSPAGQCRQCLWLSFSSRHVRRDPKSPSSGSHKQMVLPFSPDLRSGRTADVPGLAVRLFVIIESRPGRSGAAVGRSPTGSVRLIPACCRIFSMLSRPLGDAVSRSATRCCQIKVESRAPPRSSTPMTGDGERHQRLRMPVDDGTGGHRASAPPTRARSSAMMPRTTLSIVRAPSSSVRRSPEPGRSARLDDCRSTRSDVQGLVGPPKLLSSRWGRSLRHGL